MHANIKYDLFMFVCVMFIIAATHNMIAMCIQAAILIGYLITTMVMHTRYINMSSELNIMTEYMSEIIAFDNRKSDIAVASYKLFRESRGWPVTNLQPVC